MVPGKVEIQKLMGEQARDIWSRTVACFYFELPAADGILAARFPGGHFGRRGIRNTIKIHELIHVAIHVADVARSSAFYRDVLRLEMLPRPAFDFPGAWFRLGTQQELHLIGRPGPVALTGANNHFALTVDSITLWETHLKQTTAAFNPKQLRPDGAWQIFLRDPDGHYIELFAWEK